jgi:hypothetical protein
MLRQDAGLVSKIRGKVAIGPAAPVFQRLWQVPVVQRAEGPNTRIKYPVNQTAVMVNALLIDCAPTRRLNARPGDRKTVALLIQALQYGNILRIQVVLIACDIARRTTPYLANSVREAIPNRLAFPVLFPCSSTWYAAVAMPRRKSCGNRALPIAADGIALGTDCGGAPDKSMLYA